MLYVGKRLTLAHFRQRAPTGVSTRHFGQIGVPHLPHAKPVSTSLWMAHFIRMSSCALVAASLMQGEEPLNTLAGYGYPTYRCLRGVVHAVEVAAAGSYQSMLVRQ